MADNDFVVKNGLVVNTNLLVANGDANRVGINTATPDAALTVAGTANISGNVTLSSNLTVSGNSTFNGRFEVINNAYVDKKLYVGNTQTMIQDLPTIIQAVDNFNGFVMISSQNLSKLDDACADLITYADNTNGLTHFNDIGINNSRFDGTLHRISANTQSDSFVLGEKLFQRNNSGANIAVGILRDRTVINSTSRSLKISVLETDGIKTTLGAPQYTNTAGANLSLRGETSGANADILVAVGFFESDGANGTYSRRNFPFTVGRRGDGYLYNANSALTIGTTGGGMRTDIQTVALTFSSGANQVTLSSGNTSLIYADMNITGTGIPVNTYVTSVVNSTAFNLSAATTAGSSGNYTLVDPYYDASGNPIIFHVGGMTANDEIARFTGNGNFTIGPNTTARNSKLTVAGTANIVGNAAFGGDITVSANVVATNLNIGANVTVGADYVKLGNSTVNAYANSTRISVSNSTSNVTVTPASVVIGNSTVNTTLNSIAFSGTANNTTFVGTVTAANVVSNAQLSANLANYQTTAGLSANVAKLTANNTSFVGTVTAANVVSNAQLSANLANYQTTAGLSANVATLTANNAGYLGGIIASSYQTTSGNVSLTNITSTTNATSNVVTIGAANASFDSGVLFVDSVNNRVGVNTTTPDAALTVNGSVNVASNLWIGGNFTVNGTLTTTGTFQATGDINPSVDGYSLGNSTFRWNLTGINANLVGNVAVGANLTLNNSMIAGNSLVNSTAIFTGNSTVYAVLTKDYIETSGNVVAVNVYAATVNASSGFVTGTIGASNGVSVTPNLITVGNSTVNATVNSTVFSKTANNTSFVGSVSAANVVSNAQLSANLANYQTTAGLSANVATLTSNNSTNFAGQPASYYTNATNITTGTLPYAQIPSNVINTTAVFTRTANTTFNANVILGAGLSANGGYGTAGQVLHSNGTATYWAVDDNTTYDLLAVANTTTNQGIIRLKDSTNANDDVIITGAGGVEISSNATHILVTGQVGDITGVTAGNGLTGGGTAGDINIDVGQGNGISVTADAIYVTQGTGLVVNTTGVHVNTTYIATLNANNASFLGGTAAAGYQTTAGLSANVATLTSNNSLYLGGTLASGYQTTAGLSANVATLTSNNATYLGGQLPSYYTDANNISTGTVASARIAGSYTGITAVGTLSSLTVTANVNVDSGTLFVDSVNNRVGVNTTAPSVSLQIAANDAIIMPIGNTTNRPAGANGMFRYNQEVGAFEGYSNGAWGSIAGTGAGGYYKGNLGASGNTASKANLYRINSNTQSNNITIEAGENALTAGPMVIQDGYSLVINEGGRAVIV